MSTLTLSPTISCKVLAHAALSCLQTEGLSGVPTELIPMVTTCVDETHHVTDVVVEWQQETHRGPRAGWVWRYR